jgi:hypothetical protein
MLHTLHFSLQNTFYFIVLTFLVPVLFTFDIQGVLKFKCKTPVPKGYVSLCGGCIYSLYVDATVVLARYVKHPNCKLYYQQLHLKYLCNLARYWLQAHWGWHDSVETCSSVIICETIVRLLVIVQNKQTIHGTCIEIIATDIAQSADCRLRTAGSCTILRYIFLALQPIMVVLSQPGSGL